jgi:DNA-binding response OmpR family regulator
MPRKHRGARMKILVVEDEAQIRHITIAALKASGHEVVGAETGVEALACARTHRPDLVLLDLQLPVMDGRQFLRIFREYPRCAEVPIVVMSGEHGVVPSQLGIQAFIDKPFDLDELLDTVEQLLRTSDGLDAYRPCAAQMGEGKSP